MRGEVILINEELLKQYSNLSRNVGIDKILPYINLAQPFYVEPILGDALTEELQMQIDTNSLTELNKALILKIAPALSLWTDYLALRSLAYSITQKGLTKENSENSSSIERLELADYKLQLQTDAQMATDLLIKYLCRCQLDYPLWKPEDDCLCNKFKESTGSAMIHKEGQIYFPKKPYKGCGCENN